MCRVTVSRLTAYPFEIPLETPFRIATMVSNSVRGVFVRLETDSGVVGWGEAMPFHAINGEDQGTCMAALRTLAQVVKGAQVLDVEGLVCRMEALLPSQTTAISALDMAACDVCARSAGLSLVSWFGGSARPLPTDLTIGIKPGVEAAREAEEICGRGHKHIKIKLGSGVLEDIERVASVRSAVGDGISLRVDANQGYGRQDALRMLEGIDVFDVEFCEQPVRRHDLDGLRWLDGRSPVPVMADESCFSPGDAFRLLAEGCCSLVNVKVGKAGGLWRSRQIASVVGAAHGSAMMGGMAETRLGVTAAAHVAASSGVFRYYDLDAHNHHTVDPVVGGLRFEGGSVVLPDGPGIGAEPDGAFLDSLEAVEL